MRTKVNSGRMNDIHSDGFEIIANILRIRYTAFPASRHLPDTKLSQRNGIESLVASQIHDTSLAGIKLTTVNRGAH